MLTFEKVLAAFKDYLSEDTYYEVLTTSHGYVILGWNSYGRGLESAEFCPTPEAMKNTLLGYYRIYLQYKTTHGGRELLDAERDAIDAQVDAMDVSIQ